MNKKISSITAILMLLTLLGRVTGLLREMMLSYIYGASAMSDAYVIATTFSSIIFAGIAAAIINGYIPIAVGEKENGTLERYTGSMIMITLIGTYAFSVVIILGLRFILSFMARGFSEAAYMYAYRLSIYTLSFSPLLCIINILAGYLQIKGSFLISALQSIVTNTVMIIVFYITFNNVTKLGIGYGVSVIVPLVIVFWIAFQKGYYISFRNSFENKQVFQTWKLIVPTLGVQLAAQLNSIIDRSFASILEEGTVSSLKYAFLICTMAVSIIAVSIGTIQYPRLALAFGENKEKEAVNIFEKMMDHMLLLIIPIAFGLIVLAHPIIKCLFEHGAFQAEDTDRTAVLLQMYAFAVLGNSFQEIISRILLAAKEAKALFLLYSGYVVLNIIFNMIFVKFWQARGLALGTTLSTLLSVFAMLFYLKMKFESFNLWGLIKKFQKKSIAAGVMTVGLYFLKNILNGIFTGEFGEFFNIALCTISGMAIYFLILMLLKEKIVSAFFKRVCGRR